MMRSPYSQMAVPNQPGSGLHPQQQQQQQTPQQQPQPSQQQQQQPAQQQPAAQLSSNSGGSVGSGAGESQQQHPMNTLSLCKAGAETVQEVVSLTIELFGHLKTVQLPNGVSSRSQQSADNKLRVQDHINRVRSLFKRLHIIYERVNEDCGGTDYTPIETLIPYREEVDSRPDLKKVSETYRHYMEEGRELREQVCLRSRYLKDIIDQLRKIIWEINTMLAMRNP